MTTICLTADEIKAITGKTRYSAQSRELNRLGIDHKVRANGSILVFRDQARRPATRKSQGPDFGAIENVA